MKCIWNVIYFTSTLLEMVFLRRYSSSYSSFCNKFKVFQILPACYFDKVLFISGVSTEDKLLLRYLISYQYFSRIIIKEAYLRTCQTSMMDFVVKIVGK